MLRTLLALLVLSSCDERAGRADAGIDGGTLNSRAAWQTRCIAGESEPGCADYPPRDLIATPPNRTTCIVRSEGSLSLVSALVEAPENPSEGGMRFEFRDLAFDAEGGFVGGEGSVLYVSEPFCTFGGSCGGATPDCSVTAELRGGVLRGTVRCARLRCGDLFSIGGAESPDALAEFQIGGC